MSELNATDKKPKNVEISSFSKELLLIIFGALIGILANQVFFKANKDYEMKVELQKELLEEQYQYLNRILQFTHRYEITTVITYTQPIKVIEYIDKATNNIVKTETVELEKKISKTESFPSFIIEENKQKKFISDIEFLKQNRDKIDHIVYSKFEELLDFILENPLPKNFDYEEIEKSNWKSKKTQELWNKKIEDLYIITYEKLY